MANPVVLTKALAAAVANNIALSQVPASGAALNLNGSLVSDGVATLDTARRILITDNGNDTGVTFKITGTDYTGQNVISETLTGTSGSSVYTSQDFLTVTSIVTSGAVSASGVTVGTNAIGSTRWVVPNIHIDPFEVGATFEVVSGSVTADVEYTDDSVLAPISIYSPGYSTAPPIPTPVGWAGLTNLASNAASVINHACQGIRLTIIGGTGTARLILTQSGIRN